MMMGNVGLRMNLLKTSNFMATPTHIPWWHRVQQQISCFKGSKKRLHWSMMLTSPKVARALLLLHLNSSLSLSLRLGGKAATTLWGAGDEAWESTTYSLCTTYIHLDTYDEPSQVRYEDLEGSSAFRGVLLTWRRNGDDDLWVGVVWTVHKDGTCHISFVGREQ